MLFLALLAGGLTACYLPTPSPPPLSTVALSPTAVPAATISPSPIPPSPTPPLPTPDQTAVAATITAGQQQVAARGITPVCLRWQDTDSDGEPEWIGLYLQQADPDRLLGFVLDDDIWYDLAPPEGEDAARGLGEYSTCELIVRDINGDGRIEIAVYGHAGARTALLHIFAWDGAHYALLGAFDGDGGVRLESDGSGLADAVVVRLRPEGDLVWEIVYTWDGTHYAWTWDRYAWFYLDRPHAYVDDTPLHVLASFYLALDDRDLPGAYGLLSATAQAARAYDEWAWGFNTTLGVEVGAAHIVTQEGGRAQVAAQVRALDNVDGRVVLTTYEVEWQVVETGEGWRLENGTTQILDQQELEYYP